MVTVNNRISPTMFDTKEKAVDAINSFYHVSAWFDDYATDWDGREIRLVETRVVTSVMDYERPKP